VEEDTVKSEGNEELFEEAKRELQSDLFSSNNCMKSELDENKEVPSLHGIINCF